MAYHSKGLHNCYARRVFFYTTKEVKGCGVRGGREAEVMTAGALASGAIIGDGDRKRAPFLVLAQLFSIVFFEREVLC